MKQRTYFWKTVTWSVAGSLIGTYFPRTITSRQIHKVVDSLLNYYPAWAQLPIVAFLFLFCFGPFANLVKRYRQNWQAGGRIFTVVEGTVVFFAGWCIASLLNGSLPHTLSGYSHRALSTVLMWLGASACFLMATFLYSYVENDAQTAISSEDELIDEPIVDFSQDLLGRERFVEDFYSQIKRFPSATSLTFGLNGAWGSGKTSVLNLLRRRFRSDKGVILVDFNPWYFQSPETITRRFYEGMAEAINHKFFYPQIRSVVHRYAQILSPMLKRFGVESIRAEEATVEQTKRHLESYILQTKNKLVVIIDDLERAHGSELLTIFQIVRLGANFRSTVFVLAYDQSQLLPQLKKLGVPQDFLDKIVQVPIELPAADKNEIDRFLIYSGSDGHISQIDRIFNELGIAGEPRNSFDSKFVELYSSTLSPFFSTLRNAKRFLIGIRVRLPVVVDEVCLLDFFLLEVLRVFANAVYQDIWINSHYYLPPWTTKSMMASPFGLEFDDQQKDRRREQIRTHVESLLREEIFKENVLKILRELFAARVSDAFGRHVTYGNDAAARFRTEKRLTHPESFDKYFLLAVPKGTIPDAEVEELLSRWRAAEDHEGEISKDLAALTAEHKLAEIVNRIVVFLNKIDSTLTLPLIRSVCRHIESVVLDGDSSGQTAQLRLIFWLVAEKVPEGERQGSAEAIARDIRFIDVAVKFVQLLTDDQSAIAWGLRRSLEISGVKNVLKSRFATEFVEAGQDIFKASNNPLFVLYQIGVYDDQAAQAVSNYVLSLLEKDQSYIGTLIGGFLVEFPGKHGPNGFQIDNLRRVYDAVRLLDLVKRAGEKAWKDDKQKRAVETFVGLMERAGSKRLLDNEQES